MSRCQHGQPIRLFCVSETCNWRDAGGCENCLKKYHTHLQNIDTITIDKLQEIARMFSVDQQVKNKSKILQQAVYNYFIIVKSQISNSIDAVSKVITSKLNYPYLYSQGHLNLYRKMKNKQYKKITKKQIRKFRNFADTQNKDLIQFNQKKLYIEQVKQLSVSIKNINQSFLSYAKAIQKIDNSFSIQKSFHQKIAQICDSVLTQNLKSKDQGKKVQVLRVNKEFLSKQKSPEAIKNANLNVNPVRQQRDRKISIDNTMGIDMNRFASPIAQNFDDNEKQISQRKKKLFEMLNSPAHISSAQNTSEKKQGNIQQKNRKINELSQARSLQKQLKRQQPVTKNVQKSKTIQQVVLNQKNKLEINNDGLQKQTQDQQTENQNAKIEDSEKANIFQDLMNKGINLPQMIMHTILPRQASKQKLYEDTKDVKQRKIKIPVKQFEQKQQNQSPLLKIKRQKKKQVNDQNNENNSENAMQKFSLFNKSQENSIIEATQQAENHISPVKQKIKQEIQIEDENMHLKDRQADSLALLLQSLRLPAQKAIPLLETAIKFAYNNLSAAEYLSYLYLLIEKPRQCLQLCNKILQQLEDSPQAMQLSIHINNNKAAALNMLGRYSESIGILQKCLAFSKKDISYKNLGDAYFSISIYEKACTNYQNALRLNPHLQQAYYNLAVCYYLQDHMNEAKFNITHALKINPKNEDYLRLNSQIANKLQV